MRELLYTSADLTAPSRQSLEPPKGASHKWHATRGRADFMLGAGRNVDNEGRIMLTCSGKDKTMKVVSTVSKFDKVDLDARDKMVSNERQGP
jgi:hypothetical protein